ncbi:MAG TPA: DUF1800 domain-containing protein [Blastocatellia bacterium]|nr:DUF1800 domain-containing protein [Blastocatellia bacterium]
MKSNQRSLIRTAVTRHAAFRFVAIVMAATLTFGALSPVFGDNRAKTTRTTKTEALSEDQKIVHLLNRIGFGPRPGDVERVRALGIDKFIEQQLHPERIEDAAVEARLKNIESIHMGLSELAEKYPEPGMIARELGLKGKKAAPAKPAEQMTPNGDNAPANQAADAQLDLSKQENRQMVMEYYREHGLKPPQLLLQDLMQQKLLRAVYSERQLQEVMADFWYNHFNIFWPKGADKILTTDFEMSAIRPHTLGKFKDLLLATAKSPAMLFYLDNFQSSSPDAKLPGRLGMGQQGRLQRRGLFGGPGQPNGQMTAEQQQRLAQAQQQFAKRKPGINENYARELMELHTLGVEGGYTQKDVQEVARCLTGWTIDRPYQGGGFVFRPWMHDTASKTVLGVVIPAGGGISDGLRVIDILAHHPSTARFISKKLCERFVSDDPPAPLVERVTQVFLKTDGDITEVLRAIFTSAEFNSVAVFRAKVKSPLELAASAIRALDGDTNGGPPLHEWLRRMGEPLYQYAFPTGYGETSEKWMNTGVFFNRINFAVALANNQVNGTRYDPLRLISATSGNDEAMNQLAALIIHTPLAPDSRRVVLDALSQPLPPPQARPAASDGRPPAPVPVRADAKLDPQARRLAQLMGLLLGTAEFQRR